MIERKFVNEKLREHLVREFINKNLLNVGHSSTKIVKTSLGEKIIVRASRPGLIVGKKGENIKKLTSELKNKFKFENPEIEIAEVENPNLDSKIVAERITSALERFGIQRFKAIGHKTMQDVMNAGALGIEIIMSGKIPSARARSWRFYSGYLKKCGDISLKGVRRSNASANLKSGTVGVKVSIMPPDIKLPDNIEIVKKEAIVEEVKEKAEDKEKNEVQRTESASETGVKEED